MNTPGTIVVTGASGMIGRTLCEHLLLEGWQVRACVRHPNSFQLDGVESYRFEMPGCVPGDVFQGAQALLHCAATTQAKDLAGSQDVDVLGSRQLFDAARAGGVQRILFLSSVSSHDAAISNYGRSKRAIEGLLDPERDLALRLGLVLAKEGGGLFERLVSLVRKLPVIPLFGGGRQIVQPIHVQDLCRGVSLALDRTVVGTLVLADPEGLSLHSVLEEIASRLTRRPLYLPLPYTPVLMALGLFERLGLDLPISSENLLGLRAQQFVPAQADLQRLGLQLRTLGSSWDAVLSADPSEAG